MEGGHTNINYLNELWERNPERYARDPHDDKFLFNQPMTNGQTLMYISAKEGNLHMLSYLLSKKLNAKIKSKVDEKTEESCLQVASRWNYLKVVELLLSNVEYERKDIQEALCSTDLNEKIVRVLLDYYSNKFEPQRKEEKVLCFC